MGEWNHEITTSNPAFSHLNQKPIAYFCAEYGIDQSLPLYAGGLGVLAADTLLEAGEQGLPLVAIGMLYRHGLATYHPGNLDPTKPADPAEAGFELLKDSTGELALLTIEVDHRIVTAQIWLKRFGAATLFLLDTNVVNNAPEDQQISDHLYSEDPQTKVFQDLVLGVGGIKLLRRLGISPSVYHLNEGHTSFAVMALAVEYFHDHPDEKLSFAEACQKVSQGVVATKHTILPVAGAYFQKEQFRALISQYLEKHKVNFEEFFALGSLPRDPNVFSTTRFLLSSVVRANAVSILHAAFEKQQYPDSRLFGITNGVRVPRWTADVWDKPVEELTDDELWARRGELRKRMIAFANDRSGGNLDPERLTIVWARRFAPYKRPELLFADMDTLARLLNNAEKPMQIIIAGRANMDDPAGKELVDRVVSFTQDQRLNGRVVYLPTYSLKSASILTAGADVWLNTPIRGKEACATSGMKSALNGALQFSISDGWIDEVDWSDKGWVLPSFAEAEVGELAGSLYKILESEIAPLFYKREGGLPTEWLKRVRLAAALVRDYYSAERMLKEYFEKLYFPGTQYPKQ